jgi:repressor LexA
MYLNMGLVPCRVDKGLIKRYYIKYNICTPFVGGIFMKEKLSRKQERVFSFLIDHLKGKGYPPTVREIAGHLGLAGPNAAKKSLDILQRKGYIRKAPGSSRAIEVVDHSLPSARTRMVPVLGRIAAGRPVLAVENIEDRIVLDKSFVRWKDAFILRVRGDSMIDAHIQDNDLVLIRPQPITENGEIAAVVIGEEATVKRFFRRKNHIVLRPANSAMKHIVIRGGDVRVIGKVVGVIRQF